MSEERRQSPPALPSRGELEPGLQALAQVGVLLPGLIHTINNCLGILLMARDALPQEAKGDEVRRLVETLDRQLERMGGVLDSSYSLADWAQGERRGVDVAALVGDALADAALLRVEGQDLMARLAPQTLPLALDLAQTWVGEAAAEVRVLEGEDQLRLGSLLRCKPTVRIEVGCPQEGAEWRRCSEGKVDPYHPESLVLMALGELVRRWAGRLETLGGEALSPRGVALVLPRLEGDSA